VKLQFVDGQAGLQHGCADVDIKENAHEVAIDRVGLLQVIILHHQCVTGNADNELFTGFQHS
jgi:hypothetical protein